MSPRHADYVAGLAAHTPDRYRTMTDEQRANWSFHASELLRRSTWEAAQGFELSEEMKYTIAANAAVIVAGFGADTHPYHNVTAVVVHGGLIDGNIRETRPGVVNSRPPALSGVTYGGNGPLALEWPALVDELAHPSWGRNVVFHEFAHKLDYLTGEADGMPPLSSAEDERAWQQVMGTNFRRIQRRGGDDLIDGYAATNEAEYFAVLTETFFTRPCELRTHLPRVYAQLVGFYHQDPCSAER